MALLVWLPLDGNLRNLGTEPITVTSIGGTTIANDGKIGQCYETNGSDGCIEFSCNANINTCWSSRHFSICFWIYRIDGNRGIIFGDYQLGGGINFNIEYSGASGRFYWAGSPDLSINNMIPSPNTWYHIVLTATPTEVKYYRDGILIETLSTSLASKSKTNGVFRIARDSRTDTASQAKWNDFRLYNYTLSAKEVKEISKGLIVHYPLNNNDANIPIPNSNIPTDYQEVEYIESTGVERIDTGVKPDATTSIYVRAAFTEYTSDGMIIGAGPTGNSRYFALGHGTNGENTLRFCYGSWNINQSFSYSHYDIINVAFEPPKQTVTVNNTVYNISNATYSAGNQNLLLFATSGYSGNYYYGVGRIYNLKIHKNGVSQRDYIPCYRKSDNKPGLYDIINGQFYTNSSGSGEFKCGPIVKELPNDYSYLNYLESSGTQYIITDISSPSGISVCDDCYFTGSTGATYEIAGVSNGGYWGIQNGKFSCGGVPSVNVIMNKRYLVEWFYDSRTLYVDHTLVDTRTTSVSVNGTFVLFGCRNSGSNTITYHQKIRRYRTTFYRNNIPIGDFIPAYSINAAKPGMYDLVSDTFYVNSGTNEFIYEQILNTIYDTSGYSHNGEVINGPLTFDYITPRYNNCTRFNGTNYIKESNQNYHAMTVSLWLCFNTISNSQNIIFVNSTQKQGLGLLASNYTDRLCCSSGISVGLVNVNDITVNTWHHFVIVSPNGINEAIRTVYIDGVLREPGTGTNNWTPPAGGYLEIGRRSSSNDGFKGKLSDFRMYATALSAADVKELYETSMEIDSNGNILPRILTT